MPPKRKRNASLPLKGLQPGQKLKRDVLPAVLSASGQWGWVGSQARTPEQITLEHRLTACNLSKRNNVSICRNKYSRSEVNSQSGHLPTHPMLPSGANGELEEDIIIISDDEGPSCSKKSCKSNPYCLNYLGQDSWEDEDAMSEKFAELAGVGRDPAEYSRDDSLPIGLKNLGATCYANASLQVWYRDSTFRSGVFSCEPPEGISEEKYRNSPIFQLQVTFAALERGNKTFYDPRPLVESLQLRASEQQDAQEFSKLFMSHLDAEFKKQSSPEVRSLISKQFQGTLAYGMICHACNKRSERTSDFLEIEINFEKNSTLEDRLAASLLPETLSGDNNCEALQDATRYTELRELPPVLHFSLLRFIYDVSTMERKKSKHTISFPLTLDMRQFLGPKEMRESSLSFDNQDYLYELRGILLHKGTSAYHGHYEAQVKDAQFDSWFQCNDESVTPIKSLGDTAAHSMMPTEQSRKNRARKRKMIDDSDDETSDINSKKSTTSSVDSTEKSRYPSFHRKRVFVDLVRRSVTSRDAYMLIYARKRKDEESLPSKPESSVKPPPRALHVVEGLNAKHIKACKEFQERVKVITSQFKDLQRRVRDIYTSWVPNNIGSEDSVVLSRDALEKWLSQHCLEAAILKQDPVMTDSRPPDSQEKRLPVVISMPDILCEHGLLDPEKSKEMKCISKRAFDLIHETTSCTFEPFLRASDVCDRCMSTIFKEKLYAIEHPKHTKLFEELSPLHDDEELGYWISKRWCKDWKLMKPRMHALAEDDPGPESSEFQSDVLCEHDGLSLNTASRRKISAESLFPSWRPLSTDTEACAVCEAEIHINKEDKKEVRKRAEDEKALLRFIHQSSLDSWAHISENTSYAIVPTHFIKHWKRWVNSPFDQPKPEGVDNAIFLCEHEHLVFDPNCPNDLDSTMMIIEGGQWDVLQSLYPSGPLISLSRRPADEGGGYSHNIPIVESEGQAPHPLWIEFVIFMAESRKIEWDTAEIVIRFCRPESSGFTRTQSPPKHVKIYDRNNATRQSRRLRENKGHGQRRKITVTKATTVKDIKIQASEEFTIPTICQRLFYNGQELEDNSVTVASLELLANDVLDLREVDEILDITSDTDERPTKRQREGRGFVGTLLGSTDSPYSSSPEETSSDGKSCLTCTFSNKPEAESCEICLSPFT
ncbi:hypothetical protein CVT26_002769 [Gymnopilus dilepis]|uniref:ubiquitinyl hydrolase 1 n=1 Tax=Gymnopilus dilepis TaxID=231916 RepID=A0A409VD88_9AGAR|nr:hypothetical protein CVT26_002769 [Gymnopilus dilepis]